MNSRRAPKHKVGAAPHSSLGGGYRRIDRARVRGGRDRLHPANARATAIALDNPQDHTKENFERSLCAKTGSLFDCGV